MAKKQDSPKPQVLNRTLELLENRPKTLTYQQIENDTGLTVEWLTRLVWNKGANDPSLTRIVKLYEYLSHNKLVAP